jgi:predicted amidohydrolase YtcJ
MPGFYDAHSHIAIHSLAKSNGLNLASPPVGNITSITQIQ